MNAVSTKHLLTVNSLKLPLTRLYSLKQKSSQKNHYDTLKITPHATQSEVKSAYYKLSLQYHPDKNKTEYAKKKFQDISDAYEVLGTHETRRNYDRQILLRQQPFTSDQKSSPRSPVYSGTSKIYNFDMWTQAHYGKEFHKQRLRRNMYEIYKQDKKMRKKIPQSSIHIELVIVLLTISLIILMAPRDFDSPISKTNDTENIVRKD